MKRFPAAQISGISIATALLFLGCTRFLSSGEGRETAAANTEYSTVSGRVLFPIGRPATGASVRVRPVDYVRNIGAEPDSILRSDTTVDSSGWFHADSLRAGAYLIEINDNVSFASNIICTVGTDHDSIVLPPDTLASHQTITGTVDSAGLGRGTLYLQVFGLNRLSAVDSATGAYAVLDLAPGNYRLRLVSADPAVGPVILDSMKTDTAAPASPVAGTWEVKRGISGGTVNCLSAEEVRGWVEAGTQGGGVFMSEDGGGTWRNANRGWSDDRNVSAIIVCHDATFLAGTSGQGGIYRYVTDDDAWLPAAGLTVKGIFCFIEAGGRDGADIFAGGAEGSVYRSTDRGATWNRAGNGLPAATVNRFARVKGFIFAGTSRGLYRSHSSGETWAAETSGITDPVIQSLAVDTGGSGITIVYAGTELHGVFRSLDTGATWTAVGPGFGGEASSDVRALVVKNRVLFAGTYADGVYVSPDSGAHWTRTYIGLFDGHDDTRINDLAVTNLLTGDSEVLAGTNYGAYFYSEEGRSWGPTNTGLTNMTPQAFAVMGERLFAGTDNGVFVSDDNGDTWLAADSGPADPDVRCMASGAGGLFAGTRHGIFFSSGKGSAWSRADEGLSDSVVTCLVAPGDGSVLAGTENHGVFCRGRGQPAWTPANAGLASLHISAFAAGAGAVFAGMPGAGVFRSSNSGGSWTPVNRGFASTVINALAMTGAAGVTVLAATDVGVYRSENRGETWTKSGSGLPQGAITVLLSSDGIVYAGTPKNGVYFSANNGLGWARINDGLELVEATGVCALARGPHGAGGGGFLFAGMRHSGTWRAALK